MENLYVEDLKGQHGPNWQRDAVEQRSVVREWIDKHIIYIDQQGIPMWQMSNKIVYPELLYIIAEIGNLDDATLKQLLIWSRRYSQENKKNYTHRFYKELTVKAQNANELFWRRDAAKHIFKITEDYVNGKLFIDQHGIARWWSNKSVIPRECYEYLAYSNICPRLYFVKNDKEREKETQEFLKGYKERMKDYTPSQEELAEMRGAFGPGKEIVDFITGKKIQL